MKSFLLVWDIDSYKWPSLRHDIAKIRQLKETNMPYIMSWPVISAEPAAGDNFYLVVQNHKPMGGLIGYGKIRRDSYTFDFQYRRRSVDIEFIELNDPKEKLLIDLPTLQFLYPDQDWAIEWSGFPIKNKYEEMLKKLWKEDAK